MHLYVSFGYLWFWNNNFIIRRIGCECFCCFFFGYIYTLDTAVILLLRLFFLLFFFRLWYLNVLYLIVVLRIQCYQCVCYVLHWFVFQNYLAKSIIQNFFFLLFYVNETLNIFKLFFYLFAFLLCYLTGSFVIIELKLFNNGRTML